MKGGFIDAQAKSKTRNGKHLVSSTGGQW